MIKTAIAMIKTAIAMIKTAIAVIKAAIAVIKTAIGVIKTAIAVVKTITHPCILEHVEKASEVVPLLDTGSTLVIIPHCLGMFPENKPSKGPHYGLCKRH
eukprot:GHVO01038996.1.p2 GENE.GHVO01038996.1~~GHVO01038996.1.p2  ORF type:complete len:100 (+),score=6.80 GHVO01038996.1:3-302(+)